MVPFTDLKAQYQSIKTQIDSAMADMLSVCQFVQGPGIARFEGAFAEYCGLRAAVGVHSGTAAVHLVLSALDIGPGDEVIVPALACVGAVEAVAQRGARIVFADVRSDNGTLDRRAVERCITRRTRAILAVHLYGQVADVNALTELIAQSGRPIHLIEDAGDAPGAQLRGRVTGSFGTAGCFDFSPVGNLGAMGDAGAVVTQDLALARRMRKMRDRPEDDADRRELIGFPCRLDTLQAGVLLVKLAHLDRWNERRRALAAIYDRLLANVPGVARPEPTAASEPGWNLYVIQVEDREGLRAFLGERDIASAVHYPIPLHRLPALGEIDHVAGPLPVAEHWADHVLSLPLYPEMSDRQVHEVAEAVRQFQTRRLPRSAAEAPVTRKKKRKRGQSDER